ncbi:MAG TPA: hypothetical protein VIY28_00545 [Pseudonocardiaceae bacterium]
MVLVAYDIRGTGCGGAWLSRAVRRGTEARYSRGVGQPAPVTDKVQRILGRPARTYIEWVSDHAAAFQK